MHQVISRYDQSHCRKLPLGLHCLLLTTNVVARSEIITARLVFLLVQHTIQEASFKQSVK
jgi:hypothetical protein